MSTTDKLTKYLAEGSYARIHSNEVRNLLKLVTQNNNIIEAGFLHDVLEDTDITFRELTIYAGLDVARLVFEVTKTGPNQFANLKSKDAILIKFADRLSNISHLPFDGRPDSEKEFLAKSIFWKE